MSLHSRPHARHAHIQTCVWAPPQHAAGVLVALAVRAGLYAQRALQKLLRLAAGQGLTHAARHVIDTHFASSFLTLNGILRRGQADVDIGVDGLGFRV